MPESTSSPPVGLEPATTSPSSGSRQEEEAKSRAQPLCSAVELLADENNFAKRPRPWCVCLHYLYMPDIWSM